MLLDSTAPKPGPSPPTRTESYGVLGRISAVLPAVAHLGAGRLIAQASYGSLPPRSEARPAPTPRPPATSAATIEEFLAASTSMQQAAALTDLDGKPLIVLTADTGNDAGWRSAQDRWPHCRPTVSHRVAKATTHESLLDDEADSAAASQAIHDVVAAVRTSQPLASR